MSDQIVAAVLNGLVVAAALTLVWFVNRSWSDQIKKMNDEWAKRCDEVNDRWKATADTLLEDHREQSHRIFDTFRSMSEEMRNERNEAIDRLHEGWERAVRTTIDQMEDRYFKYTKRVIELRDPTSKRS